jgi:hypothetical protein
MPPPMTRTSTLRSEFISELFQGLYIDRDLAITNLPMQKIATQADGQGF